MEKFTTLTSHMVAIATENIDTDQIIPAQFLKTVTKKGLGDNLFFHWRYNEDGSPNPDFPLNRPEAQGAEILLAGDNFGCGSSREHAPWSLTDYGFRAIISTSFADIFRNNSLKNSLLPVIVDAQTYQQLSTLVAEDPQTTVSINLENQTLTLPDGRSVTFPIDGFSKTCMLEGLDQLGYLMKHAERIAAYEATHPARVDALS
ncbi:MAG: 3-isopropylmalate dehydratase small subunit [Chloroflexi bacterium]|nr:MAG: 3-isopropylmalate dehydratase small subunit [Chloroflexota bacterium]PIE80209.1 MAG: 3-isopropylmalate dehydratase small subunit [Chloroflexota bacterium]